MIHRTRIATILLVAAAALSATACTVAEGSGTASPSRTESTSPTDSADGAPSPTPTSYPAIDQGLISSENLCVALAAADLNQLSAVGITAASTLSTDQADDNGRCYVSDAPYGISMQVDFSPVLSGTEEWLQRTWPGPCTGESSAEIGPQGGYETALSYCTEYTNENGTARHFTAVATTPDGGIGCVLSSTSDHPQVDPANMITVCTQVFERLNGTAV